MKSLLTTVFIFIALFMLAILGFADPPEPEEGERWVRNDQYSDEFNGTSLNRDKWRDSFNGWKGRQPAFFDPASVSVGGGNMVIRNHVGVPAGAPDGYTMSGGAVQSVGETSHYGYYECNFRASRVNMSTTFWLSSSGKPETRTADPNDTYSQELDICESIGGAGNFSSDFRKKMKFNTHYRIRVDPWPTPETFYSKGNNQVEIRDGDLQGGDASLEGGTESWEDYHTYACHWRSAQEATFFVDQKFIGLLTFRTDIVPDPFKDPMRINMVTETYNWAKPYPTDAELNNDNINASYYNWVRTYVKLPVDAVSNLDDEGESIFEEEALFSGHEATRGPSTVYEFVALYKANVDRDLHIVIKNNAGVTIKDAPFNVLSGYGKKRFNVTLDNSLGEGSYTVELELRDKNGSLISTETKGLTIQDGVIGPNVNPEVSFSNLSEGQQFFEGIDLGVTVEANDSDGEIANVKLYINDELIRQEGVAPYNWGADNVAQNDTQLLNLGRGSYTLKAIAEDNRGGLVETTVNVNVVPEGLVTLSPIHDAYLQGAGGTNFNTQDLRVEHNNRISYLMFDLSTLPPGMVTSAQLQLTVGNDAGNGAIKVYQADNGWEETTINGGNKPSINSSVLGEFNGSYALNNTYTIDLSGADFTGDQITLVLEMDAGGNDVSFSAKEAGEVVAPKLMTVVETITAVNDQIGELSLYPNPTSGLVRFEMIHAYEVYNSLGVLLITDKGDFCDLSELSSGLYYVKIDGVMKRVMKQ